MNYKMQQIHTYYISYPVKQREYDVWTGKGGIQPHYEPGEQVHQLYKSI